MQPCDAVERDKELNAWNFRLSHQTSLQLQRAQPHWPRSYRAGLWSQREPHQQPLKQDLTTDSNPSNIACISLLINHDGLLCQLYRRRSRESLTEQQVPTKPSTQGSTSTYLQYFIKALTFVFWMRVISISTLCKMQQKIADKIFMDFKYTSPNSIEQLQSLITFNDSIIRWFFYLTEANKEFKNRTAVDDETYAKPQSVW